MGARLDTLLSAGVRSARIANGHFTIDKKFSPTALLAPGEGLQWIGIDHKVPGDKFGYLGRLFEVGSEGWVAPQTHDAQVLTGSRPIVDPKTGKTIGWVRAAQDAHYEQMDVQRLDVVLLIGALGSLVLGAIGGRYLQLESVEPIRTSYAALREFSADASHELRGPITAINANADAGLRDTSGVRERDRERFHAISSAAKQMKRLTEDLLLLARAGESIEQELFTVNLRASVENVMRLNRAAFDAKGISLSERVQPDIEVYGNPDQIERIIGNLLENAVRYTPANGNVEIAGKAHRSHVTVAVRDSGIGISGDHIERIFDRFWSANPEGERSGGTGLGLAIARALARRHGGDVTATSRLGHGSEFIVTLPARPPR